MRSRTWGYHKGEDIEACEAAGITPYIARPHRGINVGNGLYSKARFRYDPVADACHCPGRQVLGTRHSSITRGHVTVQYSSPAACAGCRIKARCTMDRWRRVNRWEKEEIIERMAIRLAKRPDILVIRRSTVEHPFGTIKQSMNQGGFLLRGLEKIRAEFSLTVPACNLRPAIPLIWRAGDDPGSAGLIQAAISPSHRRNHRPRADFAVTNAQKSANVRDSAIPLRTFPSNHLASRFRTV